MRGAVRASAGRAPAKPGLRRRALGRFPVDERGTHSSNAGIATSAPQPNFAKFVF